jgi:hypothetical protein
MEEDTQITRKQGKDFIESLQAAIEEAIGEGKAVSIAKIVKLTPSFKIGGKREVFKEFGNPASGKVVKNFPHKVRVGVNVLKPIKEAVPSVGSKSGKELKEQAEEKAAKAAERRAEREKEAKKAERQASKPKASAGSKKPKSKKGKK